MPTSYTEILTIVTECLSQWGYVSANHARITQFEVGSMANSQPVFQGMSRAKTGVGSDVFVKWQVNPIHDECLNHDLNHEVLVYQMMGTLESHRLSITQLLAIHRQHIRKEAMIVALVMPNYESGNVKQFLSSHHNLNKSLKIKLILTMAKNLANFHALGWIHGDIKPSNFLISHFDKNSHDIDTVLIDLGQARPIVQNTHLAYQSDAVELSQGGTMAYLAPEIWQGQPKTQASDVYALGVSMFEVLMDRRPFNVTNTSKLNNGEKANLWARLHTRESIPKLPKHWQSWQKLLEQMLAKRVGERPTMQEVMQRIELIAKNNNQQKSLELKF